MRRLAIAAYAFLCWLAPFGAYAAPTLAAPTFNFTGQVKTGGTFQVLDVPRLGRLSYDFINRTASDKCYLFFGAGTATTDTSVPIAAGVERNINNGMVPSDEIQVTCDTTNDKFYFTVQ